MLVGVSESATRLLDSGYLAVGRERQLVTVSSITNYVGWVVLRMPDHRLPKKALFSMPDSDWWKPRGGQSTTWQKGMKSLTKGLGSVGVSRLPGWGPRDPLNVWLQTLEDMAANRSQWRMCCQFLSGSTY